MIRLVVLLIDGTYRIHYLGNSPSRERNGTVILAFVIVVEERFGRIGEFHVKVKCCGR